jgi:hypothetical protein
MSALPKIFAAKKSRASYSAPLVSSMLALFWATLVLAGVIGVSSVTRSEVSAMYGPPSPDSDKAEAESEPVDNSN